MDPLRLITDSHGRSSQVRQQRPGRAQVLLASLLVGLLALPHGGVLCLGPRPARAQAPATGTTAQPATPAAPGQTAQPAQAKPTQAELDLARKHYESGAAYFQTGNYRSARTEFEEAHRLSHLPDLLYNMGRSAEREGDLPAAVRYVEQYVATKPADEETARKYLEELKLKEKSAPPLPGQTPATPPPTESKMPPTGSLALMGAGVGFLIIGIGLGAAAIEASNSIADPKNDGQVFKGAYIDTQDRGKQLNGAAIAMDVLGGLALAGGGAWLGYWLYQRQQQKKAQTAGRGVLFPAGLGIGWARSF